ncbi:MAG: PLP-dependent aspartate aminotransferase family protein [Halanaerobium sp.]|nr:PLP-dependent aspartate aminotransferase family protein [Halanaerobium sp.]
MKEDQEEPRYNFATLAIHGGQEGENPAHALNYPIFMTSTFTFRDLKHAGDTFSFATDDYVYTRGNNPTIRLLERRMALLEGGADAVAFASGMAAISSTLLSLLKTGEEIVSHQVIYGSSYKLIKEVLPQFGIKTKLVDLSQAGNLEAVVGEKTRVIYLETPANPNLEVLDIQRICQSAKEHGIKVVVDNTFATPYFQKPLELGADVVVHSATKYISGHGDVVAGLAVGKEQEYVHNLKFNYLTEFGGVLSPFSAWLLLRGLKTLGVRMKQHQQNAQMVADFLAEQDVVKKVYYPGLETFPGHQLASQQMSGFGAVLSFEVAGGQEAAREVVNSLQLIKLAVSLGDTETLVEHPFSMTHRDYSQEELAKMGLNSDLIRLSIGLEDVRDLFRDLEQALQLIG